jgi:hypothetical protein
MTACPQQSNRKAGDATNAGSERTAGRNSSRGRTNDHGTGNTGGTGSGSRREYSNTGVSGAFKRVDNMRLPDPAAEYWRIVGGPELS